MNIGLVLLLLFAIGALVIWGPMFIEIIYHVYFEKRREKKEKCRDIVNMEK